jgi:hypothetical protein
MLLTRLGFLPIFGVDFIVCFCVISYYILYRQGMESKENFNAFVVINISPIVAIQIILIIIILFG